MAKCQLKIVTESGNHFHVGDSISGKVIVTVDKQVKCKGILLMCHWRTHGQGNCSKGDIDKINLFSGTLEPGIYTYPFDLFIPDDSPASYSGKCVNISSFLTATADIPWAIDPKEKIEINISPASQANIDIEPKLIDNDESEIKELERAIWWIPVIGSIPLLILVPAASSYGIAIQAIIGFLGVMGIAWQINKTLTKVRKLKIIGPIVIATKYFPDKNLMKINIKMQPNKMLDINQLNAELTLKETAISGSGTSQTTYREYRIYDSMVLCSGHKMQAKMPEVFKGIIHFPDNLPKSFDKEDNSLSWYILIELEIDKFKHKIYKRFTVS